MTIVLAYFGYTWSFLSSCASAFSTKKMAESTTSDTDGIRCSIIRAGAIASWFSGYQKTHIHVSGTHPT